MATIRNSQIKEIHALLSELKWPRADYVKWLQNRFNVDSCVQLHFSVAIKAISEMRAFCQAQKTETMATEKQLGYIKFLWISVDYAACNEGDKLLNKFLSRRYGAANMDELTRRQASGAIAAIKQMQANAKRKQGQVTIGRAEIDEATGDAKTWVTLPDGSRIPVNLSSKQIQ